VANLGDDGVPALAPSADQVQQILHRGEPGADQACRDDRMEPAIDGIGALRVLGQGLFQRRQRLGLLFAQPLVARQLARVQFLAGCRECFFVQREQLGLTVVATGVDLVTPDVELRIWIAVGLGGECRDAAGLEPQEVRGAGIAVAPGGLRQRVPQGRDQSTRIA
jgi:hypothetical protein